MAGDQGIANAYANYFQAQETADLMSDPFYQFTQIATMAAEEWKKEKAFDLKRARKKGDFFQDNMDESFITALDGYNPQTQELGQNHLEAFTIRMDNAVANGDKKEMQKIYMESQDFAKQLRQGQEILKGHAATLAGTDGEYSDGAGLATLNKFLAGGNEDYTVFMETDPEKENYNKLAFRIKNNNGGDDLEFGFDGFDKGNVKRQTDFALAFDDTLDKIVKKADGQNIYDWDEHKEMVENLLRKELTDTDIVYSSWHDNMFGQDQSMAEAYNAQQSTGDNRSWQYIWNDQEPITGEEQPAFANKNFDEEKMRAEVTNRLMEIAKEKFNKRTGAVKKRRHSDNKVNNLTASGQVSFHVMKNGEQIVKKATGGEGIAAINRIKTMEIDKEERFYNGGIYKKNKVGYAKKIEGMGWVPWNLGKIGDELGVTGYNQWDSWYSTIK